MSSKPNKRKITVEKGSNSSSSRPSVFERLGIKTEQRDQGSSSSGNSGYCWHWNNTGNCPFGSSCKNAMHHTLISPSKQRAASNDREHLNSRLNKQQISTTPRPLAGRLHLPSAASNPPSSTGINPQQPRVEGQWEEDWSTRLLEHADEKELERRRQQLQRELELQMKKELKRRKVSGGGGSAKKSSRSSSSSSSSSSGSSSSSSGSSSDASSSSRGQSSSKLRNSSSSKQRSHKNKRDSSKPSGKDRDKKSRASSKDKKRSGGSSVMHQSTSSNRQRATQPSASSNKRRRESSSPDSSGSDRRKQGHGSAAQRPQSGSRKRGRSGSPERKPQQDRKRLPVSQEKPSSSRRQEMTSPQKSSQPPARTGGANRKRSPTSPLKSRRRSPSPAPASRGRSGKQHVFTGRNPSPAPPRRRSLSAERKEPRRGHSPPSPSADRGYQQRSGGRNSRRNSPDSRMQPRDTRMRQPQTSGRSDSRLSPEPPSRRQPAQGSSRDSSDNKRADWGRGRDYANSPPNQRGGHHRASPDNNTGSSSRVSRDSKPRPKEHERDRRREPPIPLDKGREKARGRAEESELPSLLSLMTQHPGHFAPQPPNRPRQMARDDCNIEHRGPANRDRGRFDRYDNERQDNFVDHAGDEHHRGAKRLPRRDNSPPPRQQQRLQKPREWGEFNDARSGRDWDRRNSNKVGGPMPPLRQWGPVPGAEEQPHQNRLLPPLSVRNAMQAARRGVGHTSPSNAGEIVVKTEPQKPPVSPTVTQESVVLKSEPILTEEDVKPPEELLKSVEPEVETESKEPTLKRPLKEETPDEDEPAQKRPCLEEAIDEESSGPQQPGAPGGGLDLMESDLSDISDDADDILNAEGMEEPQPVGAEEPSSGELVAAAQVDNEEAEEEEQRVEDILDDLDFEEISDGELEAEEAKGSIDALTVDWAALLNQTRSKEKEERTHRWQASQLLSRVGVSLALCGPEMAEKLGVQVLDSPDSKETPEENKVQLLHPNASLHVAMKACRQRRACLFQLRDRRGLSSADDLAFRRQLNNLPAKKPGYQFNQSADPELFKHAVQLLTAP